ncbi:3-oxoacyl-ACP synthase III family protein [Filimonas effusa]|uniref:Ketoacyl-ACP synthase III n=1 Tax=Filimonas effusa TaxID=2508721 RepID=A0A4V1MAF5_9BACT|nr:ketoacyl-ACP synthase III [Filimonas effusa]RXK85696.1 ketoacyl-ACP synthase III [Filimonas effusa]
MKCSVITGSGSYLPAVLKPNSDFLHQQFFAEDHSPVKNNGQVVIDKFQAITGIRERRYAADSDNTSDLAIIAGEKAINDSGIDRESLDLLIVAHNFGDVSANLTQADTVPALASRVKAGLGIKNPACIAFDTLFGCPGWLMAIMQVEAFFKAGMAGKALVIGAETLSRVYDPFDRDSMIFSDGAGAVIMEAKEGNAAGIVACHAVSHCGEELHYLAMSPSNNPDEAQEVKHLKMKGRKVYEYALKHVPGAMKTCMDKSGIPVSEVKKIFIHQANEKMDDAILAAFYKLYGLEAPENIMPMCIQKLGNSSVATIPTLYDLVKKNHYPQHKLEAGDVILFASVGAGMNINAVCYRCA